MPFELNGILAKNSCATECSRIVPNNENSFKNEPLIILAQELEKKYCHFLFFPVFRAKISITTLQHRRLDARTTWQKNLNRNMQCKLFILKICLTSFSQRTSERPVFAIDAIEKHVRYFKRIPYSTKSIRECPQGSSIHRSTHSTPTEMYADSIFVWKSQSLFLHSIRECRIADARTRFNGIAAKMTKKNNERVLLVVCTSSITTLLASTDRRDDDRIGNLMNSNPKWPSRAVVVIAFYLNFYCICRFNDSMNIKQLSPFQSVAIDCMSQVSSPVPPSNQVICG